MTRHAGPVLALSTLLLALPAFAQAQSPCGEKTAVERGDTLSRIAERCDVTERALMALNPRIGGSRDLRVGMEIAVRGGSSTSGDTLDRLGNLAGEAGDALAGVAKDLSSSAQELLEKNPDVRERLEGFGQRLGNVVSPPDRGGSTDRRAVPQGGSVSVSRREAAAGETVSVTAKGLPHNAQVVIGAGRPQAAYDVVQTARTGPDGSLNLELRLPDWTSDMGRVVLVVAAEDGAWALRSEPVRIAGTKL